jgi:hypothetical protein
MTAQMRHMLAVAALPDVTLQVLPAVAHPATGSEIIIADEWAYAEHAASGFVYTGEQLRPSHGSSIASGQNAARRRSQRRYWKGWPRHGLAEVLSQRGQRRVLRRGDRHRAGCPGARHQGP